MKRRSCEHPARKRRHIAATAAALLLSLFIGSQDSFHNPISAAVKPATLVQLAAMTDMHPIVEFDSPEMKTLLKRPVHPAVFDKTYFAKKAPEKIQSPEPIQKTTAIIREGIRYSGKYKKTENFYHKLIEKIADLHEVDAALIKAIVKAESSYDPQAVSHAGAMGLMQLMPATAAEVGVNDTFNPEENLHGGIKYYKKMLEQFKGDIELALAAYNAGSGAVLTYKGIPPYKETREYIERVKTFYEEYKKQAESIKESITTDAVRALLTRPGILAILSEKSDLLETRAFFSFSKTI